MKEIIRLGNAGESSRGKKYRSLVCTLSRNDVHLREYVVRNLVAGFSHIVLYDNNQVGKGMDHDVRRMLEPFIRHGLVTLVPWGQDSKETRLNNDAKNGNSAECLAQYGAHTDWLTSMDTDEYFHFLKGDTEAFGVLPQFLRDAESRTPGLCAVSFHWLMMYGEKRVLQPLGLLMDGYHHVCAIHQLPKMLFRPDWGNFQIPHGVECTNPDGRQYHTGTHDFQQAFPEYTAYLLHYYAKSVQEFITKLEQSIPPYIRYLPDAYDHQKHCPHDFNITYPSHYEVTIRSIMTRLAGASGVGDGGTYLGPLPEFQVGSLNNYDLYLFMKLRVSLGDDWDEVAYLTVHEDVAEWVKEGIWIDGLQQFLEEGFAAGRKSCWIRHPPGSSTTISHCLGK